jgi:hypothetical protein
MILSEYKIEFVTASGAEVLLLDHDDPMERMVDFPVTQEVRKSSVIGGQWGIETALGNGRRAMEWSRLEEHGSHAAAAAYCLRHPAEVPILSPGVLRTEVRGGEVWEMQGAVIAAVTTRLSNEGDFATLSLYKATAGRTQPVSGLAWYYGIPTSWILETHEQIFRQHDGLDDPIAFILITGTLTSDGATPVTFPTMLPFAELIGGKRFYSNTGDFSGTYLAQWGGSSWTLTAPGGLWTSAQNRPLHLVDNLAPIGAATGTPVVTGY